MPNQIIPVLWGKPLRKSEVNTLDKVNELVDFINNSNIHELDLIVSDQGREVITGTSTQLAQLEVYGESVQDGTPTPENPVPVQVVEGRNLANFSDVVSNNAGGINTQETSRTINVSGNIIYTLSFNRLYSGTIGIYIIYEGTTSPVRIAYITGDNNTLTFTPANNGVIHFYSPASTFQPETVILENIQLEAGTNATPYTTYGCIGLQIGETVTPIDLQGHTLAGLRSDVRDYLTVDAVGVKTIGQRVGVVDFGTLTWELASAQYGRWYTVLNTAKAPTTSAQVFNALAEYYIPVSSNAYNNVPGTMYFAPNGVTLNVCNGDAQNHPSGLLYYELAEQQTIELGTIEPPAIPSGSVVKIIATLQPEFTLSWFTEHGLPLAINDMRDYVDVKISQVNARIDELHGITRANLEVQSIPVDDSENESDTEVTENER